MSLTFYYAPMSTASLTEIVLGELAIPCEKVKLDLQKGACKAPDFLKINPNGKVPVIVHDGTVIFESAAITMYLGETFGVEKKLYPEAGPKRGEAMKWIVWSNVSLGQATIQWSRGEGSAKEAGKAEVDKHLRILDDALAGKEWLVDGRYSLTDTHASSFLDWLRFMKFDMSAYTNIAAWSGRCQKRPAYVAWLAAAMAGH